ncbi:FMN-dependent NADH:quinone oxidoreductase 4 [Vibrio crassostreae]|nr:FMN-dependent NADH:quinone oxidoreductase 4 [Vibrio crassostreae]CAK3137371.1 FMN-dependent NADH:quinone oxidoreductase 4 [Vibrio crassostreae]
MGGGHITPYQFAASYQYRVQQCYLTKGAKFVNILLINSSPRLEQSSTYLLAQTIIQQVSNKADVSVIKTDLSKLPHLDAEYAMAVCSPDLKPDESTGSLFVSNKLITELEQADVVIITSPMHNFSLPSSLKSWVDHVVRSGRTFYIDATGKHGLITNKPVYVLISSGGVFSGDKAYQPDYFTPFMREVLSTIGLNNVHFFTIEGTDLLQRYWTLE